MAQSCEICDERAVTGRNVSHSNRQTSRSGHPDRHRVRAHLDARVQPVRIFTRCARSGGVVGVA